MPDMADTVNPNHIGRQLEGAPALRITVLADEGGEAFDYETGNAGATQVANSISRRYARGLWSILYTNESLAPVARAALAAVKVPWVAASLWPAPGVYLWAATGGAVPGSVPSWCWCPPIAVQDRYLGVVDLSTVFGAFPARVAGYLDGKDSAWPADAWARFTRIVAPTPPDPPAKKELDDMPALVSNNGTLYLIGSDLSRVELVSGPDGSSMTAAFGITGPAEPISAAQLAAFPVKTA